MRPVKKPYAAEIDVRLIQEILSRGNTAEVKRTRDGVIVLEVKRTIKDGYLTGNGR